MVGSKQLGRFKAGNLSASLGEVPMFNTYIKFVVEQPETMSWKAIRSIDMQVQGRNYLEMLYICAVILLKWGCPCY